MRTRKDKRVKKIIPKLVDYEETKSNSELLILHDPIKKAEQAILYLNDDTNIIEPICREKQSEEVEKFIIEGIEQLGVSTTLCNRKVILNIAGMPGVGKTLTVESVIEKLKNNKKYSNKFSYTYFNAMNYPNPTNIYADMLLKIFGETSKSNKQANALTRLNDLFKSESKSDRRVRVVLIDELDYLQTKDESILYNLFEWTQCEHSKLVLIAIANTLNLPEKLKSRTVSRMGDRRIPFRTYLKSQISDIINRRLKETNIFQSEALRYACTKLSGFSCDIRRITFILTQALKIFINKNDSDLVSIDNIRQAFDQNIKNRPECMYIASMARQNQLVLIFIMIESELGTSKSCLLSHLAIRLRSHKMTPDKIRRVVFELEEAGIVKLKQAIINHVSEIRITPQIQSSDVKASIEREEYEDLLDKIPS